MADAEGLAQPFEAHRARLRAYRTLGSTTEAEDTVQDAWLRISRSDTRTVENLGSWLTTVVSCLCLPTVQSRPARPEVALDAHIPEPALSFRRHDPEAEAMRADPIGRAPLGERNPRAPAQRVALVLHGMFALPFEHIAPIIDRSRGAARQLASRARRRVQGRGPDPGRTCPHQAELVGAFLAASRAGGFAALLAVLDPEVPLHLDETAVRMGPPRSGGVRSGGVDAGPGRRRSCGAGR
ncbi:MAG TPA: sigma factor [Verrucomicrobiae bacterium]|nr:sigma factor [Verrucomicrobiae bacterium]